MDQYVGTVTFKDGKPVCPECLQPMQWTGLQRPTRRTPLYRCSLCKTEFPPAEARAIIRGQWYERPSTWILLAVLGVAAVAAIVALTR